MKTRSKLLLAAVSLLTVSVAATATSAYAWYTANRQVSANLTQMGVQATSGTLSISHASIGDSFSKEEVTMDEGTYDLVASASKALTDVSSTGDGLFIKPKFNHDYTKIVGEYDQTPKTEDTKIGQKTVNLSNGVSGSSTGAISAYGVISLAITIKNSGVANSAGAIDVYIDPTGTNFSSGLPSATNSARFSIIEVGSSNSVYMYCSPTTVEETEGYYYLKKGENNLISKETLTFTDTGIIQDKTGNRLFTKGSLVSSSSETTHTKSDGYLCTLAAQAEKTFLITMWIEGTDPDCEVGNTSLSTSTLVSDLKLQLGLYALEA